MTDEPKITFTDDEIAFLRHARFGELPDRVLPEQWAESLETDSPRVAPDPVPTEVAYFGYGSVY